VTFKDAKGESVTEVEGNEGDDLLSLAHEWDVDLEGELSDLYIKRSCPLTQ
jgi:hypothetical protein